MPNPFDPLYSSNSIWRGEDMGRNLTDDLDQYDSDIAELQTGKASTGHTHSEYAPSDHEHTEYAAATHNHNGYAPAEHTHNGYAAETHTHSGYAASDHSHDQSEVAGLTAALAGKSPTSHTHTPASMGAASAEHTHDTSDVTGLLATLAEKANATHDHTLAQIVGLLEALAAKADLVNGKVPASQLPDGVDTIIEKANLAAFPTTGTSGTIYVALDTNKTYRWGGTGYVEIAASLALGETASSAYRGDRGRIAYDHSQNGTVHVTADQKTTWDGKAAGNHSHTPASIGAAPSSHSHSYTDLTDKPNIPAAYTHPANHPASMITGLATVATSGNYADLSGKPTIPTTLPANGGNADTVDNKHASDFAASGHNHNADYIAKALQMVSETGSVEYEMAGLDVIATINDMPTGMHTGYCPVNSTNAPLSNESWRFLIHKTGSNYGWVLAFGSYGSVYSNYVNGGTWRGWKNLVDGTGAPLWKHESNGGFYMTANQTVTPSKPLSQCRNGWVLMWSDYDPSTGTTNNADICTTTIPKRGPTGALWTGQGFLCSVPAFMNETEALNNTYLKKVYVHDNKLVGYAGNNVGNRRDVVLRAVYEF